ncbi:sulfite exporter TauE/SafE family protein [Brevibacterium sp. BRM-1]|uniref:sulfite exporter TauE/SafE family protein n=1 Tax=Brevibacterium sp. BRM-1 TaxID=2999062 RepID=UPI00227E082D|nr:sulfite exporter TauE/SafE family protein [Brevibacterium sp. BRM-1]WAL40816.1 sulfite exporter TauE/SafE family protein [Brevibacterium sp. BRM-1]
MDTLQIVLILLAGVGAGAINAVVGSGTLITFPALVAFGVPPQTATMSNAIGLIPGNIASSLGYREEIRGQGRRLLGWVPASVLGALTGAYLLVHLPETSFEAIVPALIVVALIMVIGQPALQSYLKKRKAAAAAAGKEVAEAAEPGHESVGRKIAVFLAIYATAVYGGYFAAAQGIILIGLLGMLLTDPLQRINGIKNVLVLVVNAVAAASYIIVGFEKINWLAALLVAIGSLFGGYIGARVGRRLNPVVLRCIIVVLGLVALWRILQIH